jgi:anti-anti-sigma regulatory factor
LAEPADDVFAADAGAGAGFSGQRRRLPPQGFPAAAASTGSEVFRLDLDVVAGRLTVRGRLDWTTAHLVHDATVAMLATAGKHWRVDVAELIVGDRFGLRALTAAYRRLLRQGRRMSLEGTSPELLHALTRLRLDHHLLPRSSDPPLGPATHAETTPEG